MTADTRPIRPQFISNEPSSKRLLALAAFIFLAAIVSSGPSSIVYAHNKPLGTRPWPTQSIYVGTLSASALQAEGCAQGERSTYDRPNYRPEIARPYNGTVTLSFGRPHRRRSDGVYGTLIYNDTFASFSDIREAAKKYALGFWLCTPPMGMQPPLLRIAIGTTNNQLDNMNANNNVDAYTHGLYFGSMVNEVRNYVISTGMSAQITIAGANDIETEYVEWSRPARVRSWIAGFALSGRTYHHFGDAGGCYPAPGTTNPLTDVCVRDGNGNPVWRQEDVWYVSRGAPGARALPEIYHGGANTIPVDVNARQWQSISRYGYIHHNGAPGKVIFTGEMTQSLSCGNCHNWPEEGWSQLQYMLYNFDPNYHGSTPSQNWCTAPNPDPNQFQCHRIDQQVGWSTDIKNLR